MIKNKKTEKRLVRDLLFVGLSIIAAVIIGKLGVVNQFLTASEETSLFASFIAGIFFTSLFTIAPAGIVLATIAQTTPIYQVALFGAFGAMLGDFILFVFVRDVVAQDMMDLIKTSKIKRYFAIFKLRMFHWIVPFTGALIIASPIPDEIGIAMMGFSKVKTGLLLPVSYVMNFIGIVLVGYGFGTF